MKLQLNYVLPESDDVVEAYINSRNFNPETMTNWLHVMVENNPDLNFFFTTTTTDIWALENDSEKKTNKDTKYRVLTSEDNPSIPAGEVVVVPDEDDEHSI